MITKDGQGNEKGNQISYEKDRVYAYKRLVVIKNRSKLDRNKRAEANS